MGVGCEVVGVSEGRSESECLLKATRNKRI